MKISDRLSRPFFRSVSLVALAVTLILAPAGCTKSGQTAGGLKPPRAEISPKQLTLHGHTRIDNYYWLNERANP